MKDFLERLTAFALERLELRARRLSKKKKQRAPGRPMSAGPSAGCGTGKGGFKAGNNCAKEDGRPNLPKSFAQKGKSATAASLPASTQALAAKAAALKGMAKDATISAARKKAAVRKKEKQDRDAAEQKAAKEAHDAKRAKLLQKLRIKKANEKLQIDGKDFGIPKQQSLFSGRGDESVVRRDGELQTEFIKRKHQRDLDAYHSEAGKIESKYQKDIDDAVQEASKAETIYRINGDLNALERRKAANLKADELREQLKADMHGLIGKFTVANAGGLARSQPPSSVYQPNAVATSSRNAEAAKPEIEKAWSWLSRVAGKGHESRIADVKITLRRGGGGSHYAMEGKNDAKIGVDAPPESVRNTTVHEYGHAIESARPQTLKALEEDYKSRVAEFLSINPGAKIQGLRNSENYDVLYKAGEKAENLDLYSPSYLGYARRYSDSSFKQSVIDEYANHPDRARMNKGTEIFSTGIESLYKEPAAFRRRARHGHDISLLILAGLL